MFKRTPRRAFQPVVFALDARITPSDVTGGAVTSPNMGCIVDGNPSASSGNNSTWNDINYGLENDGTFMTPNPILLPGGVPDIGPNYGD